MKGPKRPVIRMEFNSNGRNGTLMLSDYTSATLMYEYTCPNKTRPDEWLVARQGFGRPEHDITSPFYYFVVFL
jgi:hypothetical protein